MKKMITQTQTRQPIQFKVGTPRKVAWRPRGRPRRVTSFTPGRSNNLKIVPLGGLEEIGRNTTVFEFGNDIFVVDMGLQFPEADMPGIDYIIPNVAYLEARKHKIRGIIITHGHYDHIGAIPHLMQKLGNPPIYASELTRAIILRRQEDFPQAPKLDVRLVKKGDKIKLGCFEIEFFHVNHNIPGGFGLAIKTPVGLVVHTGDFKFDHSPIADEPADISKLAQLGQKKVLVLLSDSTNAEVPGNSISEKDVQDNLETIFKTASGRILISTFASLLSRVQEIINLAEKYGRHIAVDGYSMKMNVEIARQMKYLKAKKGTFISIKQLDDYPPNKIVIVCTGAQAEGGAVLTRIAHQDHRYIKIQPNDSVVFSSSVVPGNERTVQSLKDILSQQGAKIYHAPWMDIHASGHGRQEDLKMMLNLIKPKFFIPIHGNFYMLRLHGELAESVGIPAQNIIVGHNGANILINQRRIWIGDKKAPTSYVMVDGLGVGDVGHIVLRDRQMLAQDGIFVLIAVVDKQTGKVRGSPDIISRGFIYLRESQILLKEVRQQIKTIVEETALAGHPVNWTYVRDNLREKIGQFLYQKTQRRPMVLPVVIEV